ncbi:MAG: ATP cone domain-containing protein, partial [Candidatus Omnitrophica bacterium]|nr:ATP cone domain-containing protein [Candidatus Omnitrophota bacterium]
MRNLFIPTKVKKRDGTIVPFDKFKIELAINKASVEILKDKDKANIVAKRVTSIVLRKLANLSKDRLISIEQIQDTVENSLMEEGYNKIAKQY